MPLARGGLVIADEEEEPVGLAGIVIELVIGEPDGPVLIDDHLGREEDRVDLGYLFCTELLDHVLGDQLADMSDPGKPFDQDRGFQPLFRDIIEEVYLYLVHPLAILR